METSFSCIIKIRKRKYHKLKDRDQPVEGKPIPAISLLLNYRRQCGNYLVKVPTESCA